MAILSVKLMTKWLVQASQWHEYFLLSLLLLLLLFLFFGFLFNLIASLFKVTHHTVTHHTVLHNTGTLYTTAVLITENFNNKIRNKNRK